MPVPLRVSYAMSTEPTLDGRQRPARSGERNGVAVLTPSADSSVEVGENAQEKSIAMRSL